MDVQAHLYFPGTCEEAIRLYEAALPATVEFMMRFSQGSPDSHPPDWGEKVFHATIRLGETRLSMSDDPSMQGELPKGFALIIHQNAVDEAERAFHSLSQDGEIVVALQPTPWASVYGIIRDRFCITWKIQASS